MTSTNNNATNNAEHRYRLPRSVDPVRYEVHLVPDLDAATFSGTERIEIEAREPVTEIVCNAADLQIHSARLTPGDIETVISLDEEAQLATFALPSEIPSGSYVLDLSFDGVLNDQLRGFYRSTFTDAAGEEHVIATTQFESTDARRAFPCWDEPDRKAVFSITLDVPAGLAAFSNWPEESSEDLGSGRRRVRFADTIPMSSYIVAFVVGPLEATPPVDVDGVALRVVHCPGKAALTGFALEVAEHALRFFVDWFALPYPGPKVDLLAIPDFAAGAMENLGAVTFREVALLVDLAAAAQRELEAVASTVTHELAHMWFGDLVTMRWWNGLWLNEAFATFMALLCVDAFRPDWRVWDSFGRARAMALEVDALHSTRPIEYPVIRPEDAEGMFDLLTYEKGAGVLRMLERFVGPQSFREGVRAYLAAHVQSNTETTDLWDAIEGATGDQPVRAMMDSWIFQGGFPLVDVAAAGAGGGAGAGIEASARPFVLLGDDPDSPVPGSPDSGIGDEWLVPFIAGRRESEVPTAAPEDAPGTERLLLATEAAAIDLDGDAGAPVVANVGGYGFYRVRYDDELFGRLVGALYRLGPLERYCLVSDTWACTRAGAAPLERFLSLARHLDGERDPSVWSVVNGALDALDRATPEADREHLRAFASSVLAPQLERLGWDAVDGEDPLDETLRASLVRRLGLVAGDAAVRDECAARFEADRTGGTPLPAGIASAVLSVVARFGGEETLDALVDGFRKASDPQQERRYLDAVADIGNPALAATLHELCRSDVRSQDGPFLLRLMLLNRHVQADTWGFVAGNWDELLDRFPRSAAPYMVQGVVAFDAVDDEGEASLADSARAFLTAHPLEGREKLIAQHLEVMAVNLAFARRERARLGGLLRQA